MWVTKKWSYILLLPLCSAHTPIHKSALVKTISRGDVYSIDAWISGYHIEKLRCLCLKLQKDGLFLSSGLSYDESPEVHGVTVDRLVCDEIPSKYADNKSLKFLIDKIDDLRLELSTALCRPSMGCDELPHESYISLSPQGSILKRHLDERHEELKYAGRWTLPTRRSLSWLLYLNQDSWDGSVNGGQLRYYPQKNHVRPAIFGDSGCHADNLQIGWLNNAHHAKPVYMQSWTLKKGAIFDENQSTNGGELQTISALYVLSIFKRKIFITTKFSSTLYAINQSTEDSGISMNFHQKCLRYAKKQFCSQMSNSFSLVENYALWCDDALHVNDSRSRAPHWTEAKELIPKGGTLCLFDSVSVPHEVLSTLKGDRIAIAGWFHESVTPPQLLSDDNVSRADEFIPRISPSTSSSTSDVNTSTSTSFTSGGDKAQEKSIIRSALKGMSYRSSR